MQELHQSGRELKHKEREREIVILYGSRESKIILKNDGSERKLGRQHDNGQGWQ